MNRTGDARILICQPARTDAEGRPVKSRRRWLMGLTLPYLAALTPPKFDVTLCDERYDEIDFEGGYDLVAVSTMTHTSRRAFRIADRFRAGGVPVVMGGWHPSVRPGETLEHADAVVVGEAEGVWGALLEDFRGGRPKNIYRREALADLKGLPLPRFDLLQRDRYRIPLLPVQTTRGCPFGCAFCEVTALYGRRYRFRPVDEVVREIVDLQTGGVWFVDDNIAASGEYARELFRAIEPLKIRWTGLWNVAAAGDEELLDLAVRSGCRHINIGIESIRPEGLDQIDKGFNPVGNYEEVFRRLRKRGIFFSVNIILGLDGDDGALFEEYVRFIRRNRVPMVFYHILTPRYGTKLRRKMESEGRILSDDPARYGGDRCVFRPKGMGPEELEALYWNTYRKSYSLPSILSRLLLPPRGYLPEALLSNLAFRWAAGKKMDPIGLY